LIPTKEHEEDRNPTPHLNKPSNRPARAGNAS